LHTGEPVEQSIVAVVTHGSEDVQSMSAAAGHTSHFPDTQMPVEPPDVQGVLSSLKV
jgi:hypothetical protein